MTVESPSVPLPQDRFAEPSGRVTDGEAGLWFVDQSAPDPGVYHAPRLLELSAPVDVDALRSALATVIERHESLRLVFEPGEGGPRAAVRDHVPAEVAQVSVDSDAAREETIRALAGQRLDLGTGPLIRATVISGPGRRDAVLVNVHHIATDAGSAMVMVREFATAYRNALRGRPGIPEPVTCWSRAEYLDWLAERADPRRDADDAAYWAGKLGDAPVLLPLRTDFPRPQVQGRNGGHVRSVLDPGLVAEVTRFARAERVTPFMVYVLAYALLLREYGAGDDVPVGTPVSLRDHQKLQGMIGYLANMVCLRLAVPGGASYRELLERTKREVLESLRHKELAFGRVVELVAPRRSSGHAPVFQAAISMTPVDITVLDTAEPRVVTWTHLAHGAKYDLLLIIEREPDGLGATLEFDAALFRTATAQAMATRFSELVATIVSAPDQPLPALADPVAPALAAPAAGAAAPAAPAPPDGVLLGQIRELWLDVLDLDEVGDDEDFYAAGGFSLLAAELARAVRRRLRVEVSLGDLLQDPTVRGMAAAAARAGGRTAATRHRPEDAMAADVARWSSAIAGRGPRAASAIAAARAVLVTGATGLLGSHLVGELLQRTTAEVHCLVRAADDGEARRRLDVALRRFRVDVPDPERLHCVAGDVAEDQLGMSPRNWERAGADIDAVYHMAAQFNFAASYASLRRANVDGFGNLALFCGEGRTRTLHYASSAAAFSALDTPVVTERDTPRIPDGLGIGYAQTKWVNEQLAVVAREAGIPVCVFRIGRIGGASGTGAGRPDDFFWLQLRAVLESGSAPDTRWAPVDLLPADYVARALVTLAGAAPAAGATYHLALPQPVAWDRILDHRRAAGHRITTVDAETWLGRLAGRRDEPGLALASVSDLLRGGSAVPRLATDDTAAALRALAIPFPTFDDSWLAAMIRYFAETGHFRPSAAAGHAAQNGGS
jgi:thioester reductase-like protein